MVHPEYRRVLGEAAPLEDTLTPIYPLTEGVPQGRLRALIGEALREVERSGLSDFLPAGTALPPGLPALRQALAYLHRRRAARSSPSSPPAAIRRSGGSPSRSCWRTPWR